MKNIFRFNGQHYVRITPIQQLKARIAELECELKRYKNANKISESIIDAKSSIINDRDLLSDDLEKEVIRLGSENTILNEENANLSFQVNELESDINILNNTNEDLRSEIDSWRNQECRR